MWKWRITITPGRCYSASLARLDYQPLFGKDREKKEIELIHPLAHGWVNYPWRLSALRVYSRARTCGISAIWKKFRIKFTLPRQMARKKNRPRDKYYFFEIKYSKTSLTTTLIWLPLYILTLNFYSLLLSQLPFSFSFESLFHHTNIPYSAVIRAQAFSVAQNVPIQIPFRSPVSWIPFLEK